MRLKKARVQKYRSIRDSGWFEIDSFKTLLVGPNEAGKTVLLKALEQINPPEGVGRFDPLRDFPRSELSDLNLGGASGGTIDPSKFTVVEAHFSLDDDERNAVREIDESFANCSYVFGRRLDSSHWHRIHDGPNVPAYRDIKKDLIRLATHVDEQSAAKSEEADDKIHRQELNGIVDGWRDTTTIRDERAETLVEWLDHVFDLIDEKNPDENDRFDRLTQATKVYAQRNEAVRLLVDRLPVFVYFSNYFRVRPRLHLGHLADRIEQNILEDDEYDRGNECLLKLLGFSARELSDLGKAPEPSAHDQSGLQTYQDQLDKRSYQLNAASVRLTEGINEVWQPDIAKGEASRLRVVADQQYLKVVVEDGLGVEVELDQRSEGYQWLVSFFVVFFAEARDRYENAILLLDEPGMSLHGLKQREFRTTVSRLAEANQVLYTTHSPFMVGSDELDLVRVVEMDDRTVGSKVHTTVTANDSAALLPLQEALGYDLAQSLFTQRRNLVLEGLTDYWYLESTAKLLASSGDVKLYDKIALIPANAAGKVVYFATILHANHLKVAALLDSDAAGDAAAKVETLVHTLGNKNILRTMDAYSGAVKTPEIEDLLRGTLIDVARAELGWDVKEAAAQRPHQPIVSIFESVIGKRSFSKYRLAKAFIHWTREHQASELSEVERTGWQKLIRSINRTLK